MTHETGTPRAATASPPRGFDVFLSYTRRDGATVERIARRLVEAGMNPFFDRWSLTPGRPWQEELANGLRSSSACAVFVGPAGLGDWSREELAVAQDRAARDPRFRLFMVLLDGAPRPDDPRLAFLSTRTWIDLRRGIDDRDAFDELLAAVAGTPRRRTRAAPADAGACPYRGLAPFSEADAAGFFGREDDVRRLVERLREARFLAVLGPSGSGKSSLVRAGLVPALRGGALPGSETWTIRTIAPGARPLDRLAAELTELFAGDGMQRTLDELERDERTLDLAVTFALDRERSDRHLLLVVDQFEEVFTLCSDERQRDGFIANLVYAATIPGGRTAVVAAMRADFYHRCAAHARLRTLVAAQQFLVGPIEPEGLRAAIEEPAWQAGLALERGLVELLVGEVENRAGALPLLQHVLLELWTRRQDRLLTLEAYAASGGVEGALGQRADQVYAELSEARRATAQRVLLRLVQPGEGTEDTRRRAETAELATGADTAEDVEAVLAALADTRLITTGRDATTGARVVEITHEALISGWPLLRSWIDRDREALLAERRLGEAAREWDASGRDDELLYRGARLAAWAERDLDTLSPLEREFLATARDRRDRERALARRRIRIAFGALAVVAAAIGAAALVALREGQRARAERDVARSRQLATAAEVQLAAHPAEALRLALRAYGTADTDEAETVLRQATFEYRAVAGSRGHHGSAYAVAVSPDGRVIASGGDDGVSIWRWRTHEKPRLVRLAKGVHALAFSPDGRRLAAVGGDGWIWVWSIAHADRRVVVGRGAADVRGIAFGRGGRSLVTADRGRGVRIWSPSVPGRARALPAGRASAYSLAVDRDGRIIAGGARGGIRIWSRGVDAPPLVVAAGRATVRAVAVSDDGRRIAAGDAAGKVRVWTLGRSRPDVVLDADRDGVLGVAFIRGGRGLVAGGEDSGLHVWDRAGHLLTVLTGPSGRTWSVAPGPGDARFVSASDDGIVWMWRPPDDVVLGAGRAPVYSVAVSPDGRSIASGGIDRRVRLWRLARNPGPPRILGTLRAPIGAVAFDASGRRLLVVDHRGGARIWNDVGRSRAAVLPPGPHRPPLYAAVVAPNGRQVVTAADDGGIRLVDVTGRKPPTVVIRHHAPATSVAVSPDGRRIVSAGLDKTVRVASLAAPHEARVAGRYDHELYTVAFSPDGRRLVSGALDGTVWIGSLDDPFERALRGHDGNVWRAVFTGDGRSVVSGGDDGTVRVWDLATGGALILRGHRGTVESVAAGPGGRFVVSGGDDATVRIWPCDVCGRIGEVARIAQTRWLG